MSTLVAMQSPQSFPAYYGTGLQTKEPTQANPLDFSYSQCRMQSPNYYTNQNTMPNFMSMSQTSQVNGYSSEPVPPFQHGQITGGQNTAASPVDHHQGYFPNQEPSQNCSFHQYAWLKSTAPENWWHNSTSSKNLCIQCFNALNSSYQPKANIHSLLSCL